MQDAGIFNEIPETGILNLNITKGIRFRKKSCISWNVSGESDEKQERVRKPKTSNTKTLTIEEVQQLYKVSSTCT